MAHIESGSPDNLLECLVHLTAHYGRAISAPALVAGMAYDGGIMTPRQCVDAAERAGLKAKIVKKENLSDIKSGLLPVVLILNNNRGCVLLEHGGKGVKIFSPASGKIETISHQALEKDYSGHCILVNPSPQFLNPQDGAAEKGAHWFWDVIRESKASYALVLVSAVFINIFALVSPLFVMNVYDRVIPNNAIETGWALAIGTLIVFIFDFVMRTLRGSLVDIAGRRMDVIVGRKIFDQVLNMKIAGRPRSSGSFANMLKDFDSVREFFNSASVTVLVDLPFALLFLFTIYYLAGGAAFILLGLVLVVIAAGFILQAPLKAAVRKAVKSSEAKHGLLVESIHGLETIKTSRADGMFRARYGSYLAENAACGQQSRFLSSLGVNIALFVQQIASVLLIIAGMYLVQSGDLSVGALIASVMLSSRALAPVGQVAGLMTRYHQASSALKTLENLMEKPVDRPTGKKFLHRPDLGGAVSFDKVSFSYPGTDRLVLDNVSFTIKAGEKVGIIGRVGSGKSTIARLMAGLYDPAGGTILMDGTDHRQIDPADLRRSCALIEQDVYLFSASLRDNIAISNPQASDEDVLQAARLSGAHDFISRHPLGYDAPAGEHGGFLSGGQRQSLAFARTILAAPNLLIGDEPTNAMDMQSENNFMQYVRNNMEGKTFILITHKHNMLPLVDRLILMDQGKILMDGPRDEVIKKLQGPKITNGEG